MKTLIALFLLGTLAFAGKAIGYRIILAERIARADGGSLGIHGAARDLIAA